MRALGRNRVEAVAYYRTSSASNVGADKDSLPRQQEAVRCYAKAAGLEVVAEFYDPGVSGADPIEVRPGFAALLDRIEGNGCRVVLVEDASRFARDLMVQELGIGILITRGVRVLTASGDDLTASDDPARIMLRQVLASFAEFERRRLVAKLKAARDRTGRHGGRPPVPNEVVREARRLFRRSPKTGERRSLREIGRELAALGHVGPSGKPYAPGSIKRMVESRRDDYGARGSPCRPPQREDMDCSPPSPPLAGAGRVWVGVQEGPR